MSMRPSRSVAPRAVPRIHGRREYRSVLDPLQVLRSAPCCESVRAACPACSACSRREAVGGGARGDHLVDHARRGSRRRRGTQRPAAGRRHPGRRRPWPWTSSRPRTGRGNERVWLVAFERAEVEAEPGQADGVQRRPCHVIGTSTGGTRQRPASRNRSATGSDPQHHRVVGAHRPRENAGMRMSCALAQFGSSLYAVNSSTATKTAVTFSSAGPTNLLNRCSVHQLRDQIEAARQDDTQPCLRCWEPAGPSRPGQLHVLENEHPGRIRRPDVHDSSTVTRFPVTTGPSVPGCAGSRVSVPFGSPSACAWGGGISRSMTAG